jgi:hypothetical protein
MPTYATLTNMQQHYTPGVFAYSPETGEESSANPADYFFLTFDGTLKDENGGDMVLVRRETRLVDVTEPPE